MAIVHVHCITTIPVHATCIISFAEATHLRGVLRYLAKRSLVYCWKRIGIELALTYVDLEVIERDKHDVQDRAAAMLHQWLTSGRATKQALLDAVEEVNGGGFSGAPIPTPVVPSPIRRATLDTLPDSPLGM